MIIQSFMWPSIRQAIAIFKKNLKRHLSNKKKLLSHFIFPLVICLVYYFYQSQQDSPLNPIKIVLNFLLTIYIGLINSSTLKQTITLFINQRQEGSRQYQFVMGLCKRVHTVSNIFYMMAYTSVFLFPFYVMVNLYGFHLVYVYNFAAFVVSSNLLAITLTSFFKEHKVATELIGIFFSLAAFLPLAYHPDQHNLKYYLARTIPNSAFTLAITSTDKTQAFYISLTSFVFCKFYLLIFYAVQFRQDFFQSLKRCYNCCRRRLSPARDAQNLMNQIEIESSAVLSSSQLQDDPLGAQATPTIQLANISKKFGMVTAVDNLSLKIYKNEILGLLGRNGAGKTTLVDMVTKVTTPSAGQIKFCKEDIKIGICYQHEILYEDLTVIDHLRFYAEIKLVDQPQEEIEKIVRKVGIEGELHKMAKELSGGNKRKLSFSIALLDSPQLLIFDEPTSGLDPLSRRNIWEILQQLRSSQSTIILTTHHLDQADYLSDKICVIKKGVIIEQGTPSQIKQKHGKGYYLTLLYNPSPENSRIPFDILLYSKILAQSLRDVEIADRSKDSVKYFIHHGVAYKDLIKCVETLERLEAINVTLETNNLEQSFIALNASEGSGISLDNGNGGQQGSNSDHMEQNGQSVSDGSDISQITGVLLKNFYCLTGKFHYFYNLNLIILLLVTLLNNLLLSKISQSVSISSELPTQSQTSADSGTDTSKASKTNALFILQGYILMSSAFLAIPVLEKEEKIIQLLRTRGLKKVNYWLGHFIFDFTYFWLNYGVIFLWFGNVLQNLSLWVIAGTAASMILYSYTASMLFNKVKTANSWFTVLNSLLWLIMLPLMIPGSMIQNSFYRYLVPLKYAFPYFDISLHLMRQSQLFGAVELIAKEGAEGGDKGQTYTVHFCFLVYLAIFVALQSRIFLRIFRREDDEEIIEQIKLSGIYKRYGNTEALRNVNYVVNNERVALLGHNGAGKSTTFGLLSAQLNPTEGRAFLERKLKKRYEEVMTSAGICYQQDTLWKFMTPMKIIRVFSKIVGIRDSQKQADWLFDNMDIEMQLKDRKFDNLSGGNKRKICMAVCIMGCPNIKLLDQCSTGLDPVSRLSMVNTLKLQNKGSVIFTTHSIPEAEQICSRAIIMKHGQVAQDNKIHKLKEKYYNVYWVQLQINQSEEFDGVVRKVLENLRHQAFTINSRKKRVQIKKQEIKLSELMPMLAKAKAKEWIKDFNIDEPKLQDVYLLLTADQGQQEIQMQPM